MARTRRSAALPFRIPDRGASRVPAKLPAALLLLLAWFLPAGPVHATAVEHLTAAVRVAAQSGVQSNAQSGAPSGAPSVGPSALAGRADRI